MSYIWEHNELSEADKSIALSLANSLGINPVMGTLLVNLPSPINTPSGSFSF